MWKDYFYFSKGQRAAIVVLIFLISIVIVLNYSLEWFYKVTKPNNLTFRTEVEAFKKTLVSRDSIRELEWERINEERQRKYKENYQQFKNDYSTDNKSVTQLFPFNPNKIDSIGLIKLGLKPYVASNIIKYRNKGGQYRTTLEFSKVYGISKEKFAELEPYIKIAEIKEVSLQTLAESKKIVMVELNSADTTLLMQVKGIGRGYAKGIVRFRKQMGGFVSVEQLLEIYGMRPENYERIKDFCTVNQNLVDKISINTATPERLDAHPYINFYQAKAMYELRRQKGKLKSKADLSELPEFTQDKLEKISPYLSFE